MHYAFRNYKPEIFYTVGPYPLNLIGLIERSPNLKLTDAVKTTLGLPDLMFYDFEHINEKYDNITFVEWVKQKKIPQDIYDIILQPPLSVTLNERKIFSATEMLAYIQIYFLSSTLSNGHDVTNINYDDAILKPWLNHLKKFNTK